MHTLTQKEWDLLQKIVNHNEFGEKGCLDNYPWSWAVCGTKSDGAVLGSLVKKGLCQQQGRGDDATCGLTEDGIKLYLEHFGAEGTFRN